jgi:hypothetical protein
MEHQNNERRDWSEAASLGRRIIAPARHEGVGNALRRAYISHNYDLPADMVALLAKMS